MDRQDEERLRLAFRAARRSVEPGNLPFGAVPVDADGSVVLEGQNTSVTDHDPTGHAEATLMREAGQRFDPEYLAGCTMYSSAEPCPMCAGTAYWVGVGRVVYGLDIPTLDSIIGANPLNPTPHLRAAEVLAGGKLTIRLEGPALVDEAAAVHGDFWTGPT